VRVVFRVKTNRGNDDEDYGAVAGYVGHSGAAIIDSVNITMAAQPRRLR
jgi:hypothetical protein